jgi:maltokinase
VPIERAALSGDVLADWIGGQRWFASKARDIAQFSVVDSILLEEGPPLLALALVEARMPSGTHELYQLPLGVRTDDWADGLITRRDGVAYYDALADPEQTALLGRLLAESAVLARDGTTICFAWEGGEPPGLDAEMRPIEAEQSNSSTIYDDRLVLKVYRRVEAGINPELEMLRFLAAHDFENIAELNGWYGYSGELMDATLGVMQRYVADAVDGWQLALDALASATARTRLLERLDGLGRVTGAMHATLAGDADDPDFAPEEPADENVALLTATIDEQIERLFVELPDTESLQPIRGRGEELRDRLAMLSHTGIGGRLIRTHGDYHLGQTLLGPDGWVVLDFEGEPGRPLLERRRKRSPLRDVAGMLRSFAYVALAGSLLSDAPSPPSGFEELAREHFLTGYMAEIDPGLLPAGQAATEKLLAIFELEKALYELRYELNNRPDWVVVPVTAIARLLEEPLG